ncbi:MAG TPA: SDR family oxidoreductase [Steroidobacteraceae bacterium]|nr:SDR family oxidoreductase [Steroidobacteraceae bacterium]
MELCAATRRDFLTGGAVVALPLAGVVSAASQPPPSAALLAGKTAVIYGAAGAMGGAVARAFAREGATVILTGRNFDRVDAVAAEITASGGRAIAAGVDALDRAAVEKHLGEVVRLHGGIDVSFNLIGLGGRQGDPLVAMNVDDFSEAIVTAMRTHYLTATAAARYMTARKSGVILALTAQVARKPYVASGGFGVACAAIEGLWRQLAVELGPAGIRLVTLRSSGSPDAPGVRSAVAEHAKVAGVTRETFEARIAEKTMLRRMPLMAEIANLAVLAASDRASSLTAAVLNATCGEIAD